MDLRCIFKILSLVNEVTMTHHPKGNRDLIRKINTNIVLTTIKNYAPISRTEIAKQTGLSAATITAISGELIEQDLVFEKEQGDSSGGRKPVLLAINPNGAFVIGIKLSTEHITGALTDFNSNLLLRTSQAVKEKSVDKVITQLISVVENLMEEKGVERSKLLGVGVGLAGIVNSESGKLVYSPIFDWRNVSIVKKMEAKLHIPVYIDNDVNTLTMTENLFGAGKGVDDFLTVTIGRGIGLGIVVNGQIYRGGLGGAGEFGHTVIGREGPLCSCGKRGCLEGIASDPAMLKRAKTLFQKGELGIEPKNIENLFELAHDGNQAAISIFEESGEALGIGISNLINLFNPQLIILSGEGIRSGEFILPAMYNTLEKNVMQGLKNFTEIRVDVWDDDAWARGAASLVLTQLFEYPFQLEER